ncbi:MAG: ribosomal L7Ae/L30e/S12e/Gadd45 family protein [Clostridia bacterium]|nr:ribosomal L7Ae/L30e/S12e/Gadd45 family protein [Clostridia bacterium]
MENEKFFRMLGLATKMRGIVFGEGAVRDSIKSRRAEIVIVSEDVSDNTKKRFKNSCDFYEKKLIICGDRCILGKYTGRDFAVVIAVTDKNIAKSINDIFSEEMGTV